MGIPNGQHTAPSYDSVILDAHKGVARRPVGIVRCWCGYKMLRFGPFLPYPDIFLQLAILQNPFDSALGDSSRNPPNNSCRLASCT